jgi:hypothetical protein
MSGSPEPSSSVTAFVCLRVFDPTLGIYAAYAYAEANLMNKVRSVNEYMRSDLETDLFDVSMLAGAIANRSIEEVDRVVPFCPMLSQGWNWLRIEGIKLPKGIESAPEHLVPALWTTFNSTGVNIIASVVREGRLQ